jgi:hypothetical protein
MEKELRDNKWKNKFKFCGMSVKYDKYSSIDEKIKKKL